MSNITITHPGRLQPGDKFHCYCIGEDVTVKAVRITDCLVTCPALGEFNHHSFRCADEVPTFEPDEVILPGHRSQQEKE